MTDIESNTAEASPAGPFERLRQHLSQRLSGTSHTLAHRLGELFGARRALDNELLEELEAILLAADIGVDTTRALIDNLGARLARKELADAATAYRFLRQDMLGIVQSSAQQLVIGQKKPFVILVVGVNGAGKTTTIAKLARRLLGEGHTVLLAAADTFRAAAVEQLQIWGKRLGIAVIAQGSGADAAAVAHDAMQAAAARDADVLILDTAGRQPTQSALMEELKKIRRVLGKHDATAPHEVLLVVDATTGQNALAQLKHFGAAVNVSGLALTKLDGTAKGGIAVALARTSGLPIRYLGIGEGMDDLVDFDAEAFIDAILGGGTRPS